jgi:hypothetical protein
MNTKINNIKIKILKNKKQINNKYLNRPTSLEEFDLLLKKEFQKITLQPK